MYVAGIDFDTHAVHVVLLDLDSDAAWYSEHQMGSGDAFDRCRTVRALSFNSWLEDVLAVAIERPMGISRGAVAALMRVQGAILAKMPPNLLVHELKPPEWKKRTVGDGSASKADVREWALERWDQPALRQDAFDAFCIAWALRSMIEFEGAAAA